MISSMVNNYTDGYNIIMTSVELSDICLNFKKINKKASYPLKKENILVIGRRIYF